MRLFLALKYIITFYEHIDIEMRYDDRQSITFDCTVKDHVSYLLVRTLGVVYKIASGNYNSLHLNLQAR